MGFRVVDRLAERWQAGPGRSAFGGQLYEARPARPGQAPRRVLLFQPHTYMNRSGSAVAGLMQFYKAEHRDLLVVLDDMALDLGQLRFRAGGSSGGHRGLADVLTALGSEQVPRLRIGIGAAPGQMDGADYVLTRFGADEQDVIQAALGRAAQAVEDWIAVGLDGAMDTYNRKTAPTEGREKDSQTDKRA